MTDATKKNDSTWRRRLAIQMALQLRGGNQGLRVGKVLEDAEKFLAFIESRSSKPES